MKRLQERGMLAGACDFLSYVTVRCVVVNTREERNRDEDLPIERTQYLRHFIFPTEKPRRRDLH